MATTMAGTTVGAVAASRGRAHERSVLEEVTRLRNAAREVPADDVAGRAQAERALTTAIGKLVALAENYPALKASANFSNCSRI